MCTHKYGIVFSLKKRDISICNNTDGPVGHYAKWNKPERVVLQILQNLCVKSYNYTEIEWCLQGMGREKEIQRGKNVKIELCDYVGWAGLEI
jgi:hypothetical protein